MPQVTGIDQTGLALLAVQEALGAQAQIDAEAIKDEATARAINEALTSLPIPSKGVDGWVDASTVEFIPRTVLLQRGDIKLRHAAGNFVAHICLTETGVSRRAAILNEPTP